MSSVHVRRTSERAKQLLSCFRAIGGTYLHFGKIRNMELKKRYSFKVFAVGAIVILNGCGNPKVVVSPTATPAPKFVEHRFEYTALCEHGCTVEWTDSGGDIQRTVTKSGLIKQITAHSGQTIRLGVKQKGNSLVIARINELQIDSSGKYFAPDAPLRYDEGKGRAFCDYTVIYE